MSVFKEKIAVVTGASSGIGLELAKLLAQEGADLVLVARDAAKLEKTAALLRAGKAANITVISKDLAVDGAPRELFEEIRRRGMEADILINNAGFGTLGEFHSADLGKSLAMIDLHVRSLTALTFLFLGPMVKRSGGWILNVASTAGFQAVPTEAVYAATKAYVIHFSEALSEELRGTGVRVSCLCPGPTETPFFGKDFSPSKIMRKVMMDPRRVAECGLRALKDGKPLSIAGFPNRTAQFFGRFLPRKFVARAAHRMVRSH